MYAKIFQQIYDSSLAEDYLTRFVFEDFLVLADSDGVVDMTPEAISRRTNVPLKIVRNAIVTLEKQDPRSRSPEFDGVRLKRLDDHRDWGWVIVNYDKYREMATEQNRKEKTRDRVRKLRDLRKKKDAEPVTPCNAPVTLCNADVTKSNDKERESEMQKEKNMDMDMEMHIPKTGGECKGGSAKESRRPAKANLSDEAWMDGLKRDKTYEGVDVAREYGKMVQWCAAKRKIPSRQRFVNWLNRIERPMSTLNLEGAF